jgi:hypothetical protein
LSEKDQLLMAFSPHIIYLNVIDSKKGTSQKLLDEVLFWAKLKMSEYRLHWILINS